MVYNIDMKMVLPIITKYSITKGAENYGNCKCI